MADLEPYASLSDLLNYIQVDGGDLGFSEEADGDGQSDWEEYIQGLQAKARARIDTITQRGFEYHPEETVTLSGKGKSTLRMPHPVHEVHKIKQDGKTVSSDSFEWEANGSLVKTQTSGTPTIYGANTLSNRPATGPSWGSGLSNVEATITYGYEEPPQDVQLAEMMLVDHTLVGQVQKRQSPVVQTDDFQVEQNIPISLNKEVEEMLAPYKVTRWGN